MLWSTIGLLTGAILLVTCIRALQASEMPRVRWLSGLMFAWTLNVGFGMLTFGLVYLGVVESYNVWKPMLMASSVAFMAIGALVLHAIRNVPAEDASIDPAKARALGVAGIVAMMLAAIPLVLVVIA